MSVPRTPAGPAAPAPVQPADAYAERLARRATGLLRRFNDAGVLDVADVHVARRLGSIGGVGDEAVLLAAALAARAPRLGHVCVDLATVASTAGAGDDDVPPDLPWPETGSWLAALAGSPLTGEDRPLRLEGSVVYLERLHAEERRVAAALLARAAEAAGPVDADHLGEALERLFPEDGAGNLQRCAARAAALRRLTVVAGGPGTGKTTTVARALVLLEEQTRRARGQPLLVALTAPTGKAAARLDEAVRHELARLGLDAADLGGRWRSMTLHRLLGTRPDSSTRFLHDAEHPLVHDVVVVDEASMLSLSLMDRLLAAVRPDARLVLVGDPEQLASVEAGVVLGDLVGPAGAPDRGEGGGEGGRRDGDGSDGGDGNEARDPGGRDTGGVTGAPIGGAIVVLQRVHRFGGALAELAAAVRDGDAARALTVLQAGDDALTWVPRPAGEGPLEDPPAVQMAALEAWGRVAEHAVAGEAAAALEALGAFRVLCAHRRGPAGARGWTLAVERWLAAAGRDGGARGRWYAGQPLLVTENDYDLRLFNGDTGVVVASRSGRLAAAFDRGGEVVELSPARLRAVETCFAMTIHKAQGSQFDAVAVVLPDPGSRILTRELLYTGVTRASRKVTLVGDAEAVTAAVERPVGRASGLGRRLWRPEGGPPPD